MGERLRIHIFHDDGTIRRMPVSKYDKLTKEGSKETFPEYANKKVRAVFSLVEFEGKFPVAFRTIQYFFMSFTETGKYDCDLFRKENLALYNNVSFGDGLKPKNTSNVIDISAHIARNKIYWKPTKQELRLLKDSIFHDKRKG